MRTLIQTNPQHFGGQVAFVTDGSAVGDVQHWASNQVADHRCQSNWGSLMRFCSPCDHVNFAQCSAVFPHPNKMVAD